MVKKLITSLVLTSLVSCLVGLIFVSKFWIIFALAFVVQVLFFYFFNTVYENKLAEKAALIKNEQVKELTKCVINVECPCKKHVEEVLYRFDRPILFTCPKCKGVVKVVADVKAILTTTPVNELRN